MHDLITYDDSEFLNAYRYETIGIQNAYVTIFISMHSFADKSISTMKTTNKVQTWDKYHENRKCFISKIIVPSFLATGCVSVIEDLLVYYFW
jgi:hypothetical protein